MKQVFTAKEKQKVLRKVKLFLKREKIGRAASEDRLWRLISDYGLFGRQFFFPFIHVLNEVPHTLQQTRGLLRKTHTPTEFSFCYPGVHRKPGCGGGRSVSGKAELGRRQPAHILVPPVCIHRVLSDLHALLPVTPQHRGSGRPPGHPGGSEARAGKLTRAEAPPARALSAKPQGRRRAARNSTARAAAAAISAGELGGGCASEVVTRGPEERAGPTLWPGRE